MGILLSAQKGKRDEHLCQMGIRLFSINFNLILCEYVALMGCIYVIRKGERRSIILWDERRLSWDIALPPKHKWLDKWLEIIFGGSNFFETNQIKVQNVYLFGTTAKSF